LDLSLHHLRDLAPPDSALTAAPWSVVADPQTGLISAADLNGHRVAVFNEHGDFLRELGSEGDGPGELRNPVALAIDPHGALGVWDAGRGILSRWSSTGALMNEQRVPVNYWGPGFAIQPDGFILVTVEVGASPLDQIQRLMALRSGSGRSLVEVPRKLSTLELPCGTMPGPPIFAPSVVWTSRADTVFAVRGAGYRIDRLVHDSLVASIRRDVPAARPSTETAQEFVEDGLGAYGGFLERCRVSPMEVVSEAGVQEALSPVMSLLAAPSGELWVTRGIGGVPEAIDMLAPDGGYEGTIDPPGVPSAWVSDSTVVVVRVSEVGEPKLSLYRVGSPGFPDSGSAEVDPDDPDTGFRDCDRCPLLVRVESGSFLMGAPSGEAPAAEDPTRPQWTEDAERPQTEVEIDRPFAIGKFEVTFAEWDTCVEAGGCSYRPEDDGWGRADRPVIRIARRDTEQFLDWLSEETGFTYRLPSEAEWEYAARAGTSTARHWGDRLGQGMAVCVRCGSEWDDRSTAPVGSTPPNPWGIHDMLGNVSEWVADCWHEDHESASPLGHARVESSPWWSDGECERPAYRGGTYASYPWAVRAAYRNYYWPGPWSERDSNSKGFRVLREIGGGAQ